MVTIIHLSVGFTPLAGHIATATISTLAYVNLPLGLHHWVAKFSPPQGMGRDLVTISIGINVQTGIGIGIPLHNGNGIGTLVLVEH